VPGSLTRTKKVRLSASLIFFQRRPVVLHAALKRFSTPRTVAIRRSFNVGPERHIPLKVAVRGNRQVAMSAALTVRRSRSVVVAARFRGSPQRLVPLGALLANQLARSVPFGVSARWRLFRFVTCRAALSRSTRERRVPFGRSFRKTRQRLLPIKAQVRLQGRKVPVYGVFVIQRGRVPIRARFKQAKLRTLPCVGRFS